MELSRTELFKGVAVNVIHTEKFRTNLLTLNFLRPLAPEEASLNALLPDVLLRGSRNLPDMAAISRWLDLRYGAGAQALVRRSGEIHVTGLSFDWIDTRYLPAPEPLTAEIIKEAGDFLLQPAWEDNTFRADYVREEKDNLVRAIRSQVNDKRVYAMKRLREEMFATEPFGTGKYGTEDTARSITPEKLKTHWNHVLEDSRLEIIYAGGEKEESVLDALRETLRELPRGKEDPVGTTLGTAPAQPREIVEKMDVVQGNLLLGFRTGVTMKDPSWPAMALLNAVYGGCVTSKLFMNVRERMSLCYYASSMADFYKGIMIVASGIAPQNYEKARDEILSQLEACRRGEITEEELEQARTYLLSSYRVLEDSLGQMESFCFGQLLGGAEGSPEEIMRSISAVTREQVQEAANKIQLDTIYFLTGEAEA